MLLPLLVSAVLSAPAAPPNVVIISIDTLRADHLNFYGYRLDTAPALHDLSKRSLVFDDVVTEIPLTSPSFCAMMSSQYPRQTGATRNGLRLPDEVPTVAQTFQSAGYETVCVTSNWTLKRKLSGLDRGFDVYNDSFHKKRWGFIKSERNAEEVTAIALELLANRDAEKPLFAWFHYSDPHAPYKKHRHFKVSSKSDYPKGRGRKVSVRYDSEIRKTDHFIEQVLEALPKENTFLVFLADHGESLWEHDYLGHGRRIHQTGLHIPFMVSGPGIAPGRTDVPMRGIDVGTTVLGLAGLTVPESMLGLDVVHGEVPMDRVRVVETYGGAVPNFGVTRQIMADKPPQWQGVLLNGWKLITDGSERELYRLTGDPMETEDLSSDHPDKVEALLALITEWSARITSNKDNAAQLSEDDMDALESLGYIE